jgi:hypothetical protein
MGSRLKFAVAISTVIAFFTGVHLLYQQFAIVVLLGCRVVLRAKLSRHDGATESSRSRCG